MLSYINGMLAYSDKWGATINYKIHKVRADAKPGKNV